MNIFIFKVRYLYIYYIFQNIKNIKQEAITKFTQNALADLRRQNFFAAPRKGILLIFINKIN